jgi:hypothetical protein
MPVEGVPAEYKASDEKRNKIYKRDNAKYFGALTVSPEVFHVGSLSIYTPMPKMHREKTARFLGFPKQHCSDRFWPKAVYHRPSVFDLKQTVVTPRRIRSEMII